MNEVDPMLGSAKKQQQYRQQINNMIIQDVEERRAARLSEFQRSRESSAVIIGTTGTSSGIINAIDQ